MPFITRTRRRAAYCSRPLLWMTGVFALVGASVVVAQGDELLCFGRLPSTEAEELVCRGMDLQEKGDLDGSIAVLERAMTLQPDLPPEAHYTLATQYMRHQEYAKALAEYSVAVTEAPEVSRYWSGRAYAAARLGEYQTARQDLDRAVDLAPSDGELRETRVALAKALHDWPTVIEDCNWLLERQAPPAKWLTERGRALEQLGRYSEAIEDFDLIVRLEPTAIAYYNRGVARQYPEEHAAAVKDFTRALALDPSFNPAYLERCRSNYRLGQFKDALSDCQTYVRRVPGDWNGFYFCGILKSRLGDQDGATAEYRHVIELTQEPEQQSNAWYGIGISQERAGRLPEAREAYQKALEINAQNEQAKRQLEGLATR